ncbi:MAG: transcriptional repressor LexA [Candidatus Tagabacteria bacterium]
MFTKKQKKVLDFIKVYSKKHGYSPSIPEMAKHFKRAVGTIHEHIQKLEDGGYLRKEENKQRGIEISKSEKLIKIPLLGIIAAGQPIEAIQEKEMIAIPKSKLPRSGECYALQVAGNSMIDENINDGDIVLIKKQNFAENGQKVVALIDNHEATLKTFYKEKGYIRLQPANKDIEPIIIERGRELIIQGMVIDVIRNENPEVILSSPKQEEIRKYDKLPLNKIICGDAIEEMRKIPDNTIDMTFADPPFNLNKKYGNYKDRKKADDYIKWCEQWLTEMVRITKPTGSIFVHNIPKWLTYCANHLNKIAVFKHWIAWDSMSTPLGKTLLPAHYGILFYTKIPKGFKFHELRSPHKKCRICGEMIKDYGGKKRQINPFGTLLSDVWMDIHRIRHNTRRDAHPCQLPEPLLERLILMTTDEKDVVLDPFIGAGTTALTAKRLGRNYIGIDIDLKYKKIVADKIKKVNYRSSNGYKYNGDVSETASKYLRNLTISEDEGIYPIDNPQITGNNKKMFSKSINHTLF